MYLLSSLARLGECLYLISSITKCLVDGSLKRVNCFPTVLEGFTQDPPTSQLTSQFGPHILTGPMISTGASFITGSAVQLPTIKNLNGSDDGSHDAEMT